MEYKKKYFVMNVLVIMFTLLNGLSAASNTTLTIGEKIILV